jgi:SAM-dependent methyltransferase
MDNKLDITIQTYREHFDSYIEKTPQVVAGEFKDWIDKFRSLLPEHSKVLELGSAFGRDARYLRDAGCLVTCTDVIPEALALLAAEGFETATYDFRDTPAPEWIGAFDGYFANAVLLHADEPTFTHALSAAVTVLKPGGIGAFSLKTGTGESVTNEKMDAPRYFLFHTEPELMSELRKLPITVLELRTRESGKWLQVIFKKN